MSQNGVLSPEGICRTFDANANGYGRGEATGFDCHADDGLVSLNIASAYIREENTTRANCIKTHLGPRRSNSYEILLASAKAPVPTARYRSITSVSLHATSIQSPSKTPT
jgi:hypothetical protein